MVKIIRARRKQITAVILLAFLLSASWSVGYADHDPDHLPIVVTTTDDVLDGNDGLCSLREAVIAANLDSPSGAGSGECVAGSGADTLVLDSAEPYILTIDDNQDENTSLSGDLDITGDLIIEGNNATISARNGFKNRIIQVTKGIVEIRNLTITGGSASGKGGGILNDEILTLIDVTVAQNETDKNGGGISNSGDKLLALVNVTVSGNISNEDGGGIANSGNLTASNVTISGNSSGNDGGGLFVDSGTTTLNNATIAQNTADADGRKGGAGGGLAQRSGSITVSNTIVAGNTDSDCLGVITSGGYNLAGDSSCSLSGTGDLSDTDPLLGPLADNGGPTQTHSLLSGSPAIDAGDLATCEPTDQRGVSRPSGPSCDIGAVEVNPPTAPELIRAFKITGGSIVDGLKVDTPGSTFTLRIYAASTCEATYAPQNLVAEVEEVTIDADGYFHVILGTEIQDGLFVVATLIGSSGDESEPSPCIVSGPGNDSWPNALRLDVADGSASIPQYIELLGQSRWYKFQVEPDSQITITLEGLTVNYDLTIYTDILETYQSLTLGDGEDEELDLLRLGAEYAPNAFSPNAFSPNAFSPNAFSPNAFSPNAFSPNAFSPNAFSPNAFSPNAFSPNAFSPDALSPDAYSPNAFSPNAFSSDDFSPNAFSPNAFSPNAFSSAQTRSLLGVSAFDGTASEGLRLNTWNSTGDFYIRVRGRNGAFSLESPFQLDVSIVPGECSSVSEPSAQTSFTATAGNFNTLILADWTRFDQDPILDDRLADLLARPEITGTIVNVGLDNRVIAANNQADNHPDCPEAKNIVAESIREIVDRYRAVNSGIKWIVILGNDEVIPFFRYPDGALLGNEDNYFPPVLDDTASQASLRLRYVLSQDAYGSSLDVRIRDYELPIAEVSVGRLVETASDMVSVIEAYLLTTNGIVSPSSSLVTGYDFLEDVANDIQAQFVDGLSGVSGAVNDSLITPSHISPQGPSNPDDPEPWTADDLAAELLGSRHDLVFLAGHFSANSALAADYSSQLLTTDLTDSATNFQNSIVFSAGCHSGYNIVNEHNVPVITFEPDWAQAFAQKGAVLIAGTGYQYGDTDFIEYSERLYAEFAQQLRTGSSPVSVGEALVRSKQIYLAGTPQLRPIHEKSYLEATIFGLPMLKVSMNNTLSGGGGGSIVTTSSTYSVDPGAFLGLEYSDVDLSFNLGLPIQVDLRDPLTGDVVRTAEYYRGRNGVQANPSEPVLPLHVDDVSLSGTVLRGVGFRGGTYSQDGNVLPLTSAPTTEIRAVHTPFVADEFFPVRPWGVNYFGALAELGRPIYLAVTPAQVRSTSPGSETVTVRKYSDMSFRLFYSDYVTASGESVPADADAPTISEVSSEVIDGIAYFRIRVNGNPAAGIQEVWITYTSEVGPFQGLWRSKNLAQDSEDSSLWVGSLDLEGISRFDVRFMVQAVNGVGMVSGAANQGAYYIPGTSGEPTVATSLAFTNAPGGGAYSTEATFSALLQDTSVTPAIPLADKVVTFGLGPVVRRAITGQDGVATVVLPIMASPGSADVRATFGGDETYIASFADQGFSISKQLTTLTMSPDPLIPPGTATATLEDVAGVELGEKTVVFVLDLGGTPVFAEAVITDYAGRATTDLNQISLAAGSYTLTTYFGGTIPLPGNNSVTMSHPRYGNAVESIQVVVNSPPECSAVVASPDHLWSPNGKFRTVTLSGASDPDNDPLTITILGVFQDEPVGEEPDAVLKGGAQVDLRKERNGPEEGRVYHIFYVVDDGRGGTCGYSGDPNDPDKVRVPVAHDNSGIDAIDGGPLFDSTKPD